MTTLKEIMKQAKTPKEKAKVLYTWLNRGMNLKQRHQRHAPYRPDSISQTYAHLPRYHKPISNKANKA